MTPAAPGSARGFFAAGSGLDRKPTPGQSPGLQLSSPFPRTALPRRVSNRPWESLRHVHPSAKAAPAAVAHGDLLAR
jgi:hypothetical protein